ncbi:MAG: thioredoxin family protein [Alphaproteobacteria bacterium]|nr:thioredoxin family protein [Alphaproteobacteria bacterium]
MTLSPNKLLCAKLLCARLLRALLLCPLLLFIGTLSAPIKNVIAQDFDYGSVAISHLSKIADRTHLLTIDFKLNKGWKIYWHSGGETALPPSITLDEDSLAKVESFSILWNYPERLDLLGIESLGYQGDITLPVEVTLNDKISAHNQAITLSGTLYYPVCAHVCIPHQRDFRITLDNTANTQQIKNALDNLPVRLSLIDSRELFWSALPSNKDNTQIILHGKLQANQDTVPDLKSLKKVIISYQAPDELRGVYLLPDLHRDRSDNTQQLSGQNLLALPPDTIKAGQPLPLLLTAYYQGQAVETTMIAHYQATPPITALAGKSTASLNLSLWVLGLLALLAGLLMNLMPCVLPVLSLKLLPIGKMQATSDRNAINIFRQNALLSALGMIIGFMLLALLFASLRLTGFIGWGAQFQSPLFLLGMIWVLLLFIAVEMGWQNFRLPFSASLINVDSSHHPILQKLTTGIVIAWLASSCTAPLIGTIVGVAIAGGTAQLFLMMGLLSLGMASPYLLIALRPKLINRLPTKIGKWSTRIKYGVSVALLLTALWLFWLLSFHFPALHTALIIIVCALLLTASYLKYRGILSLSRLPLFSIGIALLIVIAISPQPERLKIDVNATIAQAQAFMPENIQPALDDGQIVIVDFSARWCITCKINDVQVWQSDKAQDLLTRDDIIFMRGDWTLPNEAIESFLQAYHHYAIPFTIIYTPDNRQGTILPEIFGFDDVEGAMKVK